MQDILDFLTVAGGATVVGAGFVYALRSRSFLGWWFVAMGVALVLSGLYVEPLAAVLLALVSVAMFVWLIWRHRHHAPTHGRSR